MAFSKWFWDTFPKRMTALWWVFMVVLLVTTMFWRDASITWLVAHFDLLSWTIVSLIVLVGIGNYIPGVPNMPLPLLTGWAVAGGMPILVGVVLFFMCWLIAYFGSVMLFHKAALLGSGIEARWNLRDSEKYSNAVTAVRLVPKVVLKSRVGKFAAYCGHINIAAAVYRYNVDAFFKEAALGHFLWTLQYAILGFAIGWLLPYVGKLF